MGRRQRRAHAARAAGFVDDHLDVLWTYLVGMTGDAAWAEGQVRTILGGVDPRLLEEETTAARRLLLTRARRAVEDAPSPAPKAYRIPGWLAAGVADLDPDAREAFVLLDAMDLAPDHAAAACGVVETELQERRARAHDVVVAHLTGARP